MRSVAQAVHRRGEQVRGALESALPCVVLIDASRCEATCTGATPCVPLIVKERDHSAQSIVGASKDTQRLSARRLTASPSLEMVYSSDHATNVEKRRRVISRRCDCELDGVVTFYVITKLTESAQINATPGVCGGDVFCQWVTRIVSRGAARRDLRATDGCHRAHTDVRITDIRITDVRITKRLSTAMSCNYAGLRGVTLRDTTLYDASRPSILLARSLLLRVRVRDPQ